MFKFFKEATKESNNDETEVDLEHAKNAGVDNSEVQAESKKVHGEDGVCCGGCGGE
jgi:CCGSCS motif protein